MKEKVMAHKRPIPTQTAALQEESEHNYVYRLFFVKISLFCALRRFIHISISDNNLFLWSLICSELLYAGLCPGTQWSPLKNWNVACGGWTCMGGLRELRAEIFVPQGTSNMHSCIRRTSKFRRSHSSGTGGWFTDLILSHKNTCPSIQEDWIKHQISVFPFSMTCFFPAH